MVARRQSTHRHHRRHLFHRTIGQTPGVATQLLRIPRDRHPQTGQQHYLYMRAVIGSKVAGKTIDRILVGYDQPLATGAYRGYIDDVLIR